MLNAQPQLSQDFVRQIRRRVGDEVDADALGADQPDNLRQSLLQSPRRTAKQQMTLVEEQRQQWSIRLATPGEWLEPLGQQPEQEGRVNLGRLMYQLTGIQQVNLPAFTVLLQQVFDSQCRLTEQSFGTLLLQGREAPQQRLSRCTGQQRSVLAEHV